MSMVNEVLEDSLIRDLLEDAVDPTQHGGIAGSSARLEAATPVICAVSSLASLQALAIVLQQQMVCASHIARPFAYRAHDSGTMLGSRTSLSPSQLSPVVGSSLNYDLQVAQSSALAANRVSQSLLGSLLRSAEQTIGFSKDRSAPDVAMALIATIVKASQWVYAAEFQQTASSSSHLNSKQGVSGLSLQQHLRSRKADAGSTVRAGVLAGRGSDIFSMAVRSAAACTHQQCGASSTADPDKAERTDAEMHSSSPLPAYPLHELRVKPTSKDA